MLSQNLYMFFPLYLIRIKNTIKQIETIMYEFILNSKPVKIKRDVLTMDYEKGGLKMIDLETFMIS